MVEIIRINASLQHCAFVTVGFIGQCHAGHEPFRLVCMYNRICEIECMCGTVALVVSMSASYSRDSVFVSSMESACLHNPG